MARPVWEGGGGGGGKGRATKEKTFLLNFKKNPMDNKLEGVEALVDRPLVE